MMHSHLRLSNGTTWPNPLDPNEVQHKLRYGQPTREDLLYAASVLAAYRYLCDGPGNKTLPLLRREVRAAVVGDAPVPEKEG